MASSNAGKWLMLLAAITPDSAAWPRTALASGVRCRTSNSRADSTITSACRSAGCTATLGISGRADCLGVVAVVLAAPDKQLHVLQRDEPHRMAQGCQPATLMVRGAACF